MSEEPSSPLFLLRTTRNAIKPPIANRNRQPPIDAPTIRPTLLDGDTIGSGSTTLPACVDDDVMTTHACVLWCNLYRRLLVVASMATTLNRVEAFVREATMSSSLALSRYSVTKFG
jgi:hypothetical protein